MLRVSDSLTVIVYKYTEEAIEINSEGYLNTEWRKNMKFKITNICKQYDQLMEFPKETKSELIVYKNYIEINIKLNYPICIYLSNNFRNRNIIGLNNIEWSPYAHGFIKDTNNNNNLYDMSKCRNYEAYIKLLISYDKDDILKLIMKENIIRHPNRLFKIAVLNKSIKTVKLLITMGLVTKDNAMFLAYTDEKIRKELLSLGCTLRSLNKIKYIRCMVNEKYQICKKIYSRLSVYWNSLNDLDKVNINHDMDIMTHNLDDFLSNKYQPGALHSNNFKKDLELDDKKLAKLMQDILDPNYQLLYLKFFNYKPLEKQPLMKIACKLDSSKLFKYCIRLYTNTLTNIRFLLHECINDPITIRFLLKKNCLNILKYLICDLNTYNIITTVLKEICNNFNYSQIFYLMEFMPHINSLNSIIFYLVEERNGLKWSTNKVSFALNFFKDYTDLRYLVFKLLERTNNKFQVNLVLFHIFRLNIVNHYLFKEGINEPQFDKITSNAIYEKFMIAYEESKTIDISLDKSKSLKLCDLLIGRNCFDFYYYCDVNVNKLNFQKDCVYFEKFMYFQLVKVSCIQFIESLLLSYFPYTVVRIILKMFSENDILIILSKVNGFDSFFDQKPIKSKQCNIMSVFAQLG